MGQFKHLVERFGSDCLVVISNLKGENVVEKMLFAASGVGEKGVRGGGVGGGGVGGGGGGRRWSG